MRPITVRLLTLAFAAGALTINGCRKQPASAGAATAAEVARKAVRSDADDALSLAASDDVINTFCPVFQDEPVDEKLEPERIVFWKGQRIGLCCKQCRPDWLRMTEAEKDAFVESARTGVYASTPLAVAHDQP